MINIVSEEIIINGVKMGYSRQDIHERLRKILTADSLSFNCLTSDNIIQNIISNNKISSNPMNYIGRSIEQCFI
jgi:hypothetical protein